MKLQRFPVDFGEGFVLACAVASAFLGAAVTIGRLLNLRALILLFPTQAPIQFNTSIAIVCLSIAIALSLRSRRIGATVAASVALVIGGLTFLESATGYSLGIDQLVEPVFSAASPFPGRMAPNTALCLFLSASALLLLRHRRLGQLHALIAGILALFVAELGGLALFGRALEFGQATAGDGVNAMTFQGAFQLFILGTAQVVLAVRSERGEVGRRERYIPLTVTAVAILLAIAVWQALVVNDARAITSRTLAQAEDVSRQIESGLRERTLAMERIASRWEFRGGTPYIEWKTDAANYYRDLPGFLTLAWLDSGFFTRWIYPLAGNERVVGFYSHVGPERIAVIDQAVSTRKTAISRILDLKLGGRGFAIMAPVFPHGKFGGIIAASFRVREFLDRVVNAKGYEVHIFEGKKSIYDYGTPKAFYQSDWAARSSITFRDIHWDITVLPTFEALHAQASRLPLLVLVVGLALSFLIGIIARLLTASRSAERRTWEALEWRRTVIDCTPQMIIATDPQGTIRIFNPTAEKMLGYRAEEVLGKLSPLEFRHPDEVAEIARATASDRQKKAPKGFEALTVKASAGSVQEEQVTYVRKDGSTFRASLLTAAIQDADRKVSGFLGVAVDITEREEARRALERAKEAALENAQAKASFLANMSHEIRTPLNGIIGMAELLTDMPLEETAHKYAHIIQESGRGLLNIINDILDFSKIEAGKMTLERIEFELPLMVRNHVDLLTGKAQQKGLALKAVVDPEVPKLVRGDPGRIGQVVLNLLGNAIKFTQTGSVTLHISVEKAGSEEATLRFNVTDTGVGMTDAVLHELFRPFVQGDASTARKYGGTGLGLSISKRLVELMGGRIGAESAPGKGSTFWFTCKLQCSEALPFSAKPDPIEASSAATIVRTGRILVAEDNGVNRLLIMTMLKKLGFQAHAVENGREVLAALAQTDYDLILMDCQMPEMDGFATTREIRMLETTSGRHISIIALTANAMKEDEERCLVAGMDDYLSKPVKRDKLLATLSRWLAKKDQSVA